MQITHTSNSMTLADMETFLSHVWGRQAHVIPGRICGNRTRYYAADHNGNFADLEATWEYGGQRFRLRDDDLARILEDELARDDYLDDWDMYRGLAAGMG